MFVYCTARMICNGPFVDDESVVHDLGRRLHSISVRAGSMGNAQKKPWS